MSPTLNGSSAQQRFERGNVVEIHNGMLDLYPGLPHVKQVQGVLHVDSYHLCALLASVLQGTFLALLATSPPDLFILWGNLVTPCCCCC